MQLALRDLSIWNDLLQDPFVVQKFLGRDNMGNPIYGPAVTYTGHIDFLHTTRGVQQNTLGLQPLVEPDATIICNTYDIDVDDLVVLPNLGNTTASVIAVKISQDLQGPHNLTLTLQFFRV